MRCVADASDEEVPVLIVLDIISPPMPMAWCESAGDGWSPGLAVD